MILDRKQKEEYYAALLRKEGFFFVGVTTTGVFCRPVCPARKPKFEHCEFFETVQEALLASFRPCKRCNPLSFPDQASDFINKLIEEIEKNPEKRWNNRDFQSLSVTDSTVRRQFKKRFGMTFVAYARARRMGLAMKKIRFGQEIIEAQLAMGYESSSGFRDAFSRIMGAAPSLVKQSIVLKTAWLDTRLGPMIAIADEKALFLLEFVDRRGLEREIERLRLKTKLAIVPGHNHVLELIADELTQYFSGTLTEFKTPLHFLGSAFQERVWQELQRVPYGQTCSYATLASALEKPTAFRAVAQANGANQLAIVIPCHRVINANGNLGGYGGGLARKQWLINHEKRKRL